MADWKVTIVFDYSSEDEIDDDELHDMIRDSFDLVDLEVVDAELTVWTDDGVETDEMRKVAFNCDNVGPISVQRIDD